MGQYCDASIHHITQYLNLCIDTANEVLMHCCVSTNKMLGVIHKGLYSDIFVEVYEKILYTMAQYSGECFQVLMLKIL